MSAPLVAIDADVLGRQRTGDETYVRSLLHELAAASPSDLRLAAITRRPDLVPAGIEPVELPAAQPGHAHGVLRPASAPPPPARAGALRARAAALVPLPGRGHDPGPLLRARPVGDGHPRPADLPRGRPPRRPSRRPCARDLGADQARPRRALWDPRAEDHRHAARRRPGLQARGPFARRRAVRALRRRAPAA